MGTSDGPSAGSNDIHAKLGEPFTIDVVGVHNPTPKLQITAVSVETGEAARTDLSHSAGQYLQDGMATPAPGRQFVVVTFHVTNVGPDTGSWDPQDSTLVAGGVEDMEGQNDKSLANDKDSDAVNAGDNGNSQSLVGEFDPGRSGTVYGVWEVPVGATPTTLWIPEAMGTLFITPETPNAIVDLTP